MSSARWYSGLNFAKSFSQDFTIDSYDSESYPSSFDQNSMEPAVSDRVQAFCSLVSSTAGHFFNRGSKKGYSCPNRELLNKENPSHIVASASSAEDDHGISLPLGAYDAFRKQAELERERMPRSALLQHAALERGVIQSFNNHAKKLQVEGRQALEDGDLSPERKEQIKVHTAHNQVGQTLHLFIYGVKSALIPSPRDSFGDHMSGMNIFLEGELDEQAPGKGPK